jgi:CsoR family transcriptional regulator, copper-sensing transcriptional repressor
VADTSGGYTLGGMSAEETTSSDHRQYWYAENKQALLGRLRRIEGQVRGVHRMVEDDTYCIDVLTQISAATRALQAVAVGLLEGHIAHCVVEAARDGGDPSAKVKEASDAIARLVRS